MQLRKVKTPKLMHKLNSIFSSISILNSFSKRRSLCELALGKCNFGRLDDRLKLSNVIADPGVDNCKYRTAQVLLF
jgi:hypothetical protein